MWGSGTPLREFLNVDDLADACLYLLDHYDGDEFLNVGSGEEISILKLAGLVKRIVGYEGELVFDPTKPDGTPRKLTDISRILKTGWRPRIDLETGIRRTYQWYCENDEAGVDRKR